MKKTMHVSSRFKNERRNSHLSSYINDPYSIIDPIITTLESAYVSSSMFISSDISDPTIEAEVLSDLAHVALDLSIFMTPVTVLLRAFSVIGRVLDMGADYIPDHVIRTDDLVFNGAMLAVYFSLLGKSVVPVIRGIFVELSDVDEEIYEQLFQPVGVSKIQFKSIRAASIDYIDVEPNSNIFCEPQSPDCETCDEDNLNGFSSSDYMYWLYMGVVETSFEGLPISYVERNNGRSIDDPGAMGLLGDIRFLNRLDEEKLAMKTNDFRLLNDEPTENLLSVPKFNYPLPTYKSGPKGAKLLRINSNKVLELMKHDDELAASVRGLLLKSLQRKVGHLLLSKIDTKTNYNTENLLLTKGKDIS